MAGDAETDGIPPPLAWVAAAVTTGAPFNRVLGAEVLELERTAGGGRALLQLPATEATEALHNHVGGPHAAVLFALGETAAAAVALVVFGDLAGSGVVPLIKGASIDYHRLVRGAVTAEAVFAADEASARASVAERGVATFPVQVTFRVEDEEEPSGAMVPRMALKRLG